MRGTASAARSHSRSHRSHTQLAGRPQPPLLLFRSPAPTFGDMADTKKGFLGVDIMAESISGSLGRAAIGGLNSECSGVRLVRVSS